MQQFQSNLTSTSGKALTKEWLKTLTLASSFSGVSGKKSPWDLANLALKVQKKWKNHPRYNLQGLSQVCGISVDRLRLLARTAKFFPRETRFIQLSITHHIEAMRGDPDKASYWLQQATENGWSSKDIRLAIAGEGDPRKFSWLRCGTFWYFSECDSRFGIDYPGRIPGQIPANVIHYFTEPGDLVVDLMAGGGSTIDAARLLERCCLAYDLVSIRPEIHQHDALTGLPSEVSDVKLFFLDPPYGPIAKGFYDNHPSCLSRMTEDKFLNAIEMIAGYCQQALMPNGYLAILVQNVHGWTGNTVFQVIQRLIKSHWSLERRIQVPLPTQHISSSVMKWARENRQMVNIDRDLLVFRVNWQV
jgi:hypothetical protein